MGLTGTEPFHTELHPATFAHLLSLLQCFVVGGTHSEQPAWRQRYLLAATLRLLRCVSPGS